MSNFTEGQQVETKYGKGTITYFEDDFMEVTLTDRSERNFRAPFDGKVWPYVAPVPLKQLPIWGEMTNQINQMPDGDVLIAYAKYRHAEIAQMLGFMGGRARNWEELEPYAHVMVFCSVYAIPLEIMREAFEGQRLEKLLEQHTGHAFKELSRILKAVTMKELSGE